ncbi:hypothetical protein OUZ56_008064 [Daphnia magna]|uniref:Uncharacterized protein n=1 Tax=Daphnia magna TaxID=35525 RepID=A0ABR0ABU4_9CRUS|nr:hypothetical protein OUZ56_008064 [Daphnia magna]
MVGHRKIHSVVDRPDKTHEWNFAAGQFMEMQTPSLAYDSDHLEYANANIVTLFFFLFRETLSAENMEYSELSSSGSAC